MKQKTILSYILILALCLSLCAGLAGCGGKKNESPDPAKPSADPGKSGQTDTADPEFVYVPEYVDVKGAELTSSIDTLLFADGRFLTSSYCKIGERELEEGEELQWEGQNWIYGQKLFWLDLDGTLTEIPGYEPLRWEDLTGGPAPPSRTARPLPTVRRPTTARRLSRPRRRRRPPWPWPCPTGGCAFPS